MQDETKVTIHYSEEGNYYFVAEARGARRAWLSAAFHPLPADRAKLNGLEEGAAICAGHWRGYVPFFKWRILTGKSEQVAGDHPLARDYLDATFVARENIAEIVTSLAPAAAEQPAGSGEGADPQTSDAVERKSRRRR